MVVKRILGNSKAANYKDLVENIACDMNINVYYLHNHLHEFPENDGDEQGGRFHQDKRYQ